LEQVGASNNVFQRLPTPKPSPKLSKTPSPTSSPTLFPTPKPSPSKSRRARIPTFRSQPDFIADTNKNSWITPDTFEAPKIIQEISLVDPKRENSLIRYFKYGFPIVTALGVAHSWYKGYMDMTNFKNNLRDYVRMKQILKDLRNQKAERDRLNADRARYANLERLRAEGNAVWNDFQAEEQNKAIYRELEAFDKKPPTRTMIDPRFDDSGFPVSWGSNPNNLPSSHISDANFMAMWQNIVGQEPISDSEIDQETLDMWHMLLDHG
jgi:hypothetical protein